MKYVVFSVNSSRSPGLTFGICLLHILRAYVPMCPGKIGMSVLCHCKLFPLKDLIAFFYKLLPKLGIVNCSFLHGHV